jgi:N-acetyl-gamma-glutamyl-phosphate reductase
MDSSVKIKAGIIGGAGYTGGELIRLLINHPNTELTFVHSNSQAGLPVHAVHQDLLDETILHFTNEVPEEVDVLFLCGGHGAANEFLEQNKVDSSTKIIDLSQDFRWKDETEEDTVKAFDRDFIYGLPELLRDKICNSHNVANPGCFATAIQLAVLPLATMQKIESDIHVSGITGSTGAGQSLSPTSHYSWRSSNISNYKVLNHQHLNEIKRTIKGLQKKPVAIHFVPYRGPFTRGILCTTYLTSDMSLEEAHTLYKSFYRAHPFVRITEGTPDLKQVVNTNKCLLQLEKQGNQLVISSMIDNLLKGASGQAIQNMNLMFNLEETTGLKLKASAF